MIGPIIIGSGSTIGAMTLVDFDVAENQIVVGNRSHILVNIQTDSEKYVQRKKPAKYSYRSFFMLEFGYVFLLLVFYATQFSDMSKDLANVYAVVILAWMILCLTSGIHRLPGRDIYILFGILVLLAINISVKHKFNQPSRCCENRCYIFILLCRKINKIRSLRQIAWKTVGTCIRSSSCFYLHIRFVLQRPSHRRCYW